jgi:hypothetical protein
MSRLYRVLFVSLAALLFCAAWWPVLAEESLAVEGGRWWSKMKVLADDRMEGRGTGTEGYLRSARYVVKQFKRSGLKPAGTDGYLQSVQFQSRLVDEAHSSLTLVRDGETEPLALGADAIASTRGIGQVEAPLVFVGYGLSIPDQGYDDLKGLDLKGKIVVFLYGGPARIPGLLRAHYISIDQRWAALEQAGALGVIGVENPKDVDLPWDRAMLSRLQPSLVLADPALQAAPSLRWSLWLNPASMDKLLKGSGHTFAEIIALADAEKPLPRFDMPVRLRAQMQIKTESVKAPNVLGVLTGSDLKLKQEYVVLSAHLDHVGIGEPINGDRIYNGAEDNASGVASLLEIARILHERKARLRRSVLFVVVCGEEKGLLGSKYFAKRPTVPINRIVADINMDGTLPIGKLTDITAFGAEESTLKLPLVTAAKRVGVHLLPDQFPNRYYFIRSDQYNFVLQGIPSLFPSQNAKSGSPEEKLQLQWMEKHYHAPSDDLSQPVDLKDAAKFNRFILILTTEIANKPERPHWNDDSFFRRFAP